MPTSLAASGLIATLVEEHLLRCLYATPQATGGQLASDNGLDFRSIIGPLLDGLRQDHQVEVLGQRGIGEAGFSYGLTTKGTARAREAMDKTLYRGPLPVPFEEFVASVRAQPIDPSLVTKEKVRRAFEDLVISDAVRDAVGPCIGSGSALLLFGAPGNGKTAMAMRMARVFDDPIYVPHAIEVDGAIIKLFDPLVHRPVEQEAVPGLDQRWVRVRRPFVGTGGELTMANLDLVWFPTSRFYEAPFQLKANGGLLLIDDFGRQVVGPRELLNRWIVPLEQHVDYLTLVNGKRLEVPFEQMLVFASNLAPADLVDDAFLRRIRFKLQLHDPTPEQFADVFRRVADACGLRFSGEALLYMLGRWWGDRRPLRMCQPRDIVAQVLAIARYEGVEPDLSSRVLLDRACASYFAVTLPT